MTSAALKNTLLVLINLSLSRPLPPAANTSFLSPFHIFQPPPPPHRCSFNFPPKSLLAAKLYCGVTTDMAMCGDPCGSWLSMLWMGNGTRAGCFLIPSHFPFLRSQCTLKYRLNSVATWAGVTFMIISEGVVKSLMGGKSRLQCIFNSKTSHSGPSFWCTASLWLELNTETLETVGTFK